MRGVVLVTLIGLGVALASVAIAEQSRAISERHISRALRFAFAGATPEWMARLQPDVTMQACSEWRNKPPKDVAEEIKAREARRIRYPAEGGFLGDWRRGEAIAQSGYGLRFTDYPPKRANGGNCYACHQLSPGEVSFGTIGVSLKGYGRTHKFHEAASRLAYEKVYNSQAIVPCSLMPRYGVNGILSVEQIRDLVAYLMHPESPVNN